MRQSRELELLEWLSHSRAGYTWSELVGRHKWTLSTGPLDGPRSLQHGETYFPRQTLDRLLKKLITKGFVEKIVVPREKGQRGRQCTRYRIPSRYWATWGCLVVHWPAKWIGQRYFLGEERRKAYTGEKYIRLFPREAKEYRENKKLNGDVHS